MECDFRSPLYDAVLEESLARLNPDLPADALFKLRNFENGELVQRNEVFMDYLQNGVLVSFTVYDYSKFANGTDLERAKVITGAVNFIVAREKDKEKDAFIKEALLLHQALSLCSSIAAEDLRFEAAFFEAVRVLILRLARKSLGRMNEHRLKPIHGLGQVFLGQDTFRVRHLHSSSVNRPP